MASTNPNVYLLLGPEAGEKKNFLEQILRKAQKQGPVDLYKFYPYDCDMAELVSLIRTPSLFDEIRFIVIANADGFKKADSDAIADSVKTVTSDLYLIVTTDQYKLDKRLEELATAANKKIFWELRDEQKEQWIRSFFRAEGRTISPEAIERLLELVENNTQELKTACEALVGFYNHQTPITEDEIDQLIVHSKEENVFTLFVTLSEKDLQGSAEILSKMALSPDGIGVQTVTMLAWQFRRLLMLKELQTNGINLDDAFKQASISGKKNQATYRLALSNYTISQIKTIMATCTQCDATLRSNLNREMVRIALDQLLFKVCQL